MNKLLLGILPLASAGLLGAGLLSASLVQANPVGLWRTIDDRTAEPTAVIRISERDGALFGEIIELLNPKASPDAVCALCTDERKGVPIVGLTIIRNVESDSESTGPWDGGDILDPNDGKVYKVRLKLADGGHKLEVRAYIGTPILGRTQVWHKVE